MDCGVGGFRPNRASVSVYAPRCGSCGNLRTCVRTSSQSVRQSVVSRTRRLFADNGIPLDTAAVCFDQPENLCSTCRIPVEHHRQVVTWMLARGVVGFGLICATAQTCRRL
jgi:hypothetical protein